MALVTFNHGPRHGEAQRKSTERKQVSNKQIKLTSLYSAKLPIAENKLQDYASLFVCLLEFNISLSQ